MRSGPLDESLAAPGGSAMPGPYAEMVPVSPMALALSTFRVLPRPLRRVIVHAAAPSYAVGAVAVVRDADERVLLLRERHHSGWGLPGGLLRRREQPVNAVRRELAEEVALDIPETAFGRPSVVVDASAHRVDVVFVVDRPAGVEPVAQEPEVLEARWFTIARLPELFEPTADALRTVGYAVPEVAAR